jgi:hypothetical protein
MKHLLVILSLLAAISIHAVANTTRDAQYYLNTPEKFENKPITLYVAFVRRSSAVDVRDSVLFSAYTMDRDDKSTSYINVLVPQSKAESFARRYGTDFKYQAGYVVRKLSMRGVLKQIDDNWYLEYQN